MLNPTILIHFVLSNICIFSSLLDTHSYLFTFNFFIPLKLDLELALTYKIIRTVESVQWSRTGSLQSNKAL